MVIDLVGVTAVDSAERSAAATENDLAIAMVFGTVALMVAESVAWRGNVLAFELEGKMAFDQAARTGFSEVGRMVG